MDSMCLRCVRSTLTISNTLTLSVTRAATSSHTQHVNSVSKSYIRQLHSSKSLLAEEGPSPPRTDRPLVIRRTGGPDTRSSPKLLIRKHDSRGDRPVPAARPLLRRTTDQSRGPPPRRTTDSSASGSGPRQGGQPAGSFLRRRTPGAQGAQGQGSFLRRGGPPSSNGASRGPRRAGPRKRDDGGRKIAENFAAEDRVDAQAKADAFVEAHVLPKRAEVKTYRPQTPSVSSLRDFWPNTAISREGKVASMTQRINHLANHYVGAQITTDHLARRLLKGELLRIPVGMSKAHLLRHAKRQSDRTKKALRRERMGMITYPIYPVVENLDMTSLNAKPNDQAHMVNTNVSGNYGEMVKQKYAFMQAAALQLNNNETYKPGSVQRVMARIQALIPQARPGGSSAKQQAKAA